MALLAGVMASCNFTEEIYLNEDGSGSVELQFDGSELMEFSGEAMGEAAEKKLDTVYYFSDFLEEKKDSIATLSAEEQQQLQQLEPYRMRMNADPDSMKLLFTLARDFDDLDQVEDSFNAFQRAGAIDGNQANAGPSAGDALPESTEVSYGFNSGVFRRSSVITDSVLHQQRLDSLESGAMILSGSTYTLRIHFPRRVKSASTDQATLSMDGKTLIREVEFLEYLRDPTVLDLEVELEP